MKSMNEGGHDTSNNWLGFSLSPHMKMEANNTVSDTPPPPPSGTFFNPSSLTNYTALPETPQHFQSPLSIMPLKSDGSLCIMEAAAAALSTPHNTQGVVPNSSPKLEDFLGGAPMGTNHHFQIHPTDAMALSLIDSSSPFYNQVPFRQQPQYSSYYSGLNFNGIFQTITNDEHNQQQKHAQQQIVGGCNTAIAHHQFPQISDDVMKTWMLEHHHHNQQNLQVNNNNIAADTASTAAVVVEEDRGGMGCGELQSLSLSMSPGSQSSCVTRQISPTESVAAMETKKRGCEKLGGQQKPTVHRKSIDTFGQRTSQYRGVTRHRWTGRYEAHLWDNSCKKEGQTRKGRQVYLGGYDKEEKAARAYDLAALKYWGPSTHINFGLENYHQELEEMKSMSRQEYVAHLRRKSSGFSRGASIYRGVTRHHQHGRWQARIGRVAGNKDLYLGTFSTQEEAAEAYDIAAIKFRGANAVTNFDISRYDVEKIMASNTLPTGEIARRTKTDHDRAVVAGTTVPTIGYSSATTADNVIPIMPDWKMVLQNQDSVVAAVEALNAKTLNAGHYQHNSAVTVALHDLIGIESSQTTTVADDSSTALVPHFSNPSSLVTSLSSSREASPEKFSSPVLFAKPVSTWATDTQPRMMSLAAAHLPMFAAWNNA